MRHQGFTIWLTGLPSSGKTTLASLLQKELDEMGFPVEILDGDEVRQRLTKDLGFSKEDREENIRRIAYVAKLLTRVGAVALTAAISPYEEPRERARREIQNFVLVHVDCPLQVCMHRDVKGLYAKAINGEISNFTGISDPYESPVNPELTVHTDQASPEECLTAILQKLIDLNYLHPKLIKKRFHHNRSDSSTTSPNRKKITQWSI